MSFLRCLLMIIQFGGSPNFHRCPGLTRIWTIESPEEIEWQDVASVRWFMAVLDQYLQGESIPYLDCNLKMMGSGMVWTSRMAAFLVIFTAHGKILRSFGMSWGFPCAWRIGKDASHMHDKDLMKRWEVRPLERRIISFGFMVVHLLISKWWWWRLILWKNLYMPPKARMVQCEPSEFGESIHHMSSVQNPFLIPFYWLVNKDVPIGLL